MPDLGKYAFDVSLAYGISLLCLALLVGQSLWQGRRIKKRLNRIEKARRDD